MGYGDTAWDQLNPSLQYQLQAWDVAIKKHEIKVYKTKKNNPTNCALPNILQLLPFIVQVILLRVN